MFKLQVFFYFRFLNVFNQKLEAYKKTLSLVACPQSILLYFQYIYSFHTYVTPV